MVLKLVLNIISWTCHYLCKWLIKESMYSVMVLLILFLSQWLKCNFSFVRFTTYDTPLNLSQTKHCFNQSERNWTQERSRPVSFPGNTPINSKTTNEILKCTYSQTHKTFTFKTIMSALQMTYSIYDWQAVPRQLTLQLKGHSKPTTINKVILSHL